MLSSFTAFAAITELVDTAFQRHGFPCIVTIVESDGASICLLRGRNSTHGSVQVSPESVCALGALMHPLVSTLILWAAAKSMIALDQPIGEYVLALKETAIGKRVRVVDLIQHRTGLGVCYADIGSVTKSRPQRDDRLYDGVRVFDYQESNTRTLRAILEERFHQPIIAVAQSMLRERLGRDFGLVEEGSTCPWIFGHRFNFQSGRYHPSSEEVNEQRASAVGVPICEIGRVIEAVFDAGGETESLSNEPCSFRAIPRAAYASAASGDPWAYGMGLAMFRDGTTGHFCTSETHSSSVRVDRILGFKVFVAINAPDRGVADAIASGTSALLRDQLRQGAKSHLAFPPLDGFEQAEISGEYVCDTTGDRLSIRREGRIYELQTLGAARLNRQRYEFLIDGPAICAPVGALPVSFFREENLGKICAMGPRNPFFKASEE